MKACLAAAAIALGALALGTVGAAPASATTFTYDSYSVVNNTNVTITGASFNETGGSGEILFHGAGANLGQTIAAWCIDITHWLQGSGTYTFTTPPTTNGSPTGTALTADQIGKIGGLMYYATTHLNDNAAMSSAIQIAIWTVEYGNTYSYATDAGVTSQVASLFTAIGNGTISSNYNWWSEMTQTQVDGGGATIAINQGQATLVPEPVSLALLSVGVLGLGALRPRRIR